MPRIGIGLGLGLYGGSIDAQAQAHYNRVIADGGVVPAGVSGTNAFFNAVKSIYGTSDITTAISVGVDAHYLGYKMGAGSGATSGQAVQKLYSCAGSSGDVVQTTAASQPLLLSHNGASSGNYWYSPRVTGNYISSPYNSSISLRGDFDIKTEIKTSAPALQQDIFANANTSQSKIIFRLNSSNGLRLFLSLDGSNFLIYDSTANISNISDRQWVRVTRNSSTGIIQFFTSTDNVTYTQLGTDVSGATGNLFNGNSIYEVGTNFAGTTVNSFQGNIYRVLISQTIGGSAVLDFNPATYNASTSQTQWTSTTGEVWTINTGTATTGYKGVLVDRTIVQGDGVDDVMTSGTLTSRQYFTSYSAAKFYIYGAGDRPLYAGSSNSHLLYAQIQANVFNGLVLTTGNTSTALNCQTVDFNNASSKFRINAASDATGSSGTQSSTTIKIFEYGGATYGNALLRTIIQVSGIDNNTTKTAMYNYIRTLNNNAF
jgi:hypothetical protein